jgi:hypothetical protein
MEKSPNSTQSLQTTSATGTENPMLAILLKPWHDSVARPAESQEKVLHALLKDYAKTKYGKAHHADQITSLEDYRQQFPVATYAEYRPLIDQIFQGDFETLLWEKPIGWAITRGTTKGESKFIPMTPTDMRMRVSAGRAMLNYVATTNQIDLFAGVNLNLNFPSVVGKIVVGDQEVEYGYSSGIYTKYVSTMTPIKSIPVQEEIDALGGGKSIKDWEKRFDLAYESCIKLNVTLVGGVCPTAIRFAKYIHERYGKYPKDIWKTKIVTLGSVPGINTHYQPALNALYGPVAIREIYGATEGMFGQQMDEKRAWVPNYDLFFFEVITRDGIKMLHEMKPGESGGLVVSTPILPRYRIGDLIRAFTPPYFRCIGREEWLTPVKYAWDELMSANLGRL